MIALDPLIDDSMAKNHTVGISYPLRKAKRMDSLSFLPIGVIHTPFKTQERTPIQPNRSSGATGTIEVWPDYTEALSDLDGFSHIVVLYCFHLSTGFDLRVIPFLDDQSRGLFATRAPRRPNPIGLSVVALRGIRDNILSVADVDMVDGSPLLDIKPYVPHFDEVSQVRIGWLNGKAPRHRDIRADERFHDSDHR